MTARHAMPENVSINLNMPGTLSWPERCPRCGATGDLVWRNVKVVRNNQSPGNARSLVVYWYVQESVGISVPMCRAHADTNQVGGALLGRDVKSIVLRASIYVSLLCLAGWVGGALMSPLGRGAFSGMQIGWWLWCLWGPLGAALLVWARKVAAVRPIRLDPHHDIATLRFQDAAYARDFKRMNARSTARSAVAVTPIWRRMTPMKALVLIFVLLLGVVWWMGR